MSKIIITLVTFLLLIGTAFADDSETATTFPGRSDINFERAGYDCGFDDISVDIEGDEIIMTNHRHRDIVRITDRYDLIVNNSEVKMDDRQRELVKEFYHMMLDLTEYAGEIGMEGARIGAKGAALGVSALGKVFRLLDSDYDSDDLEREVEREAKIIEREAAKLEKKAENVEWMADELELLYDEMENEFVELRELHWN